MDNVVAVLCLEDGRYYTNIGYRFRGVVDGECFIEIWDLEKWDCVKIKNGTR